MPPMWRPKDNVAEDWVHVVQIGSPNISTGTYLGGRSNSPSLSLAFLFILIKIDHNAGPVCHQSDNSCVPVLPNAQAETPWPENIRNPDGIDRGERVLFARMAEELVQASSHRRSRLKSIVMDDSIMLIWRLSRSIVSSSCIYSRLVRNPAFLALTS